LKYANTIKEEISHSVEDFDRVMKWGFGWEAGPFEMIDMIGAERVGIESKPFYCDGKMLGFSGSYVERKHEPQYAQITDFPVISSHEGFNVRDMGDGVHAVSTTVKMGVFSPALIHALCDYLESGKSQHIVLTSEARVFSAGFDLKFILDCIAAEDLGPVDEELRHFQRLGDLLRQTRSCAAVFGTCLGGGFEMAASCSLIAAAPETQIGLPESRVGVLPSGGGNAIMHLRSQHNAKALAEATTLLVTGTVAANADEARKKGFLRESDVTVYHPDRLMTTAKALALRAEPTGERQWINVAGPVLGMVDRAVEELCKSGELTQHDCLIGEKIKSAMVKSTSREDSLERERKAFLELLKEGLSRTRMKHMVENGKPLRN
ncbi:MAG TPA: enoyl-CoA hydratase-related protein, partial [Fimbriimonadaceae bacterium]|nr:enoyl-CoA hydratase-related protein [Fimbriimonadaceae bacterium]